jgi:hypothetical protein
VLKLGSEMNFATKPLDIHTTRHLRRQNFYNDFSVQRRIVGYEHTRHSATTELSLENQRITKCRLELLAQISQRRVPRPV